MNAQARPTVTIIVWIVVAIAALVLLLVVLIIVAILIKYWTVLRKRAAQRAMTLRAQRGIQEPSTAQSCAFQQPHHIHSLSSEATHTLENSVLHSTAPRPLDSELQNTSPPTYSASSQYPVYIDKGLQSQSTSPGDEELPPPYIP